MNVPPLNKAAVIVLSQNEICLLLIYENMGDAQILEQMLDGYSIGWRVEKDGFVTFTLRSPAIGSYIFDARVMRYDMLESINCVSSSFRSNTGDLEHLHARPLNRSGNPR